MVESLEVVIKYRGAKYNQVASPETPSAEFAILKKDLAHLRVHSPSQRNVRRVNGSFILRWPAAGNPKVEGLSASLHTRWFKLCSDDPEALKLREFLSIESITMAQDGVLIRSTIGAPLPPGVQLPPGSIRSERVRDPLPEVSQQPATAPTSVSTPPAKPQPPPLPPPAKIPPSAPRSDRHPSHLKRRMSALDGASPPNQTRPKLDAPEAQVQPTTPVPAINNDLQQTHLPTSPCADRQRGSTTPGATPLTNVQASAPAPTHTPTQPHPPEPQTRPPSSPREPGETRPHTPLPNPAPTPAMNPPASIPADVPAPSPNPVLAPAIGARPLPPPRPTLSSPVPGSPYPSSSSSNNGDPHRPHRGRSDVSRLTRELWDTRRQLTAILAREQVILDDLERLGARPEGTSSGPGADRYHNMNELMRLEADLRTERARRVRAERTLSDVERECRAPFVVPALFQAFLSISELSN